MDKLFHLIIIAPTSEMFSGKISAIVVPGLHGRIGIRNNHAPMITALTAGDIVCQTEEGERSFSTKGGILEIKNNIVTICVP